MRPEQKKVKNMQRCKIMPVLCSCRYCEKPGSLEKGGYDGLADPHGGAEDGNDAPASDIPGDKDEVGYAVADDEE